MLVNLLRNSTDVAFMLLFKQSSLFEEDTSFHLSMCPNQFLTSYASLDISGMLDSFMST